MLKEIKTKSEHYFLDALGRIQGEYKAWHDNGVLWQHWYYVDDKLHGEYKAFDENGELYAHRYFANGELVHDFKKNPISDVEKMILVLKYGAPLLPKGEVC